MAKKGWKRPPMTWDRFKNQFRNVVGNPFNVIVAITLIILFIFIVIPLLTMIQNTFDPWFMRAIRELADYEEEILSVGSLDSLKKDPALFRQIKEFGYSDRQIAFAVKSDEISVFKARKELGILPVYSLVDTCAGEFEAFTPYYYSTYGEYSEPVKNSGKKKIMILGGGPNRIGQGIEFDYCCVHASFALRKAGFETIMVNSNPETVSTDYDTSDKLYFEPVTLEDVLHIYERD